MLSSNGSDQTNLNTTGTSSRSSSSSPSPVSQPSSFQTPQRTMEEVWKDINLASLTESTTQIRSSSSSSPLLHGNLPNGTHRHHPNCRNMTLQEFLAKPFAHDSPAAATALVSSAVSPPSPLPSSSLRPPRSGFIDHHQLNPNNLSSSVSNSFSGCPFESLAASSSGLPSFGNRSFTESDHSNSGGDGRHKRMIKNRESAARSRARKQAYTNELELKVALLMEENARLKRQQEHLIAAASQQPKRHNLNRTSTAPF
ncbi:protein FD-like [Pyrus x bretschneideri]|uniref:protein FD-like n=1 Tax=Pyrus x bretschneideri TaxID=225117 RepID=UPI0020304A14|nr:protein FD-like [Pyrus x bretschneideri]